MPLKALYLFQSITVFVDPFYVYILWLLFSYFNTPNPDFHALGGMSDYNMSVVCIFSHNMSHPSTTYPMLKHNAILLPTTRCPLTFSPLRVVFRLQAETLFSPVSATWLSLPIMCFHSSLSAVQYITCISLLSLFSDHPYWEILDTMTHRPCAPPTTRFSGRLTCERPVCI